MNLKFHLSSAQLTLFALISFSTLAQQDYVTQPGVVGSITSVGPDTLAYHKTNWSGEIRQLYPQVQFQASVSSTAITALTAGYINISEATIQQQLKSVMVN